MSWTFSFFATIGFYEWKCFTTEVLPGDASSPGEDSQNQTCLLLQLLNQQNTPRLSTSIEQG